MRTFSEGIFDLYENKGLHLIEKLRNRTPNRIIISIRLSRFCFPPVTVVLLSAIYFSFSESEPKKFIG